MTSKKMRLRKLTGNIRMRSRDKLTHLREKRLRPMGVYNYPSLIAVPEYAAASDRSESHLSSECT